jgi:hypothetical protein
MTMISFADQLFHDLMREHGPALQAAELTAPGRRRHLRRGAWLAGGAGTLAVGITASLVAFGGTSPAYAITQHSDGTVTVAIRQASGVPGANATLRGLGVRVVLVPVKAGCPSVLSLRRPVAPRGPSRITVPFFAKGGGSFTVRASGIPAADVMVLAYASSDRVTWMAAVLTTPPTPACVTGP